MQVLYELQRYKELMSRPVIAEALSSASAPPKLQPLPQAFEAARLLVAASSHLDVPWKTNH